MKKFIIILITLVPLITKAQVTLIPDQNFEFDLVYSGIDSDGTVNGQILTTDALAVNNLAVFADIKSLSGIEAFTNLEKFTANYVPLGGYGGFFGTINLNTLVNLKELDLQAANLKSLDVSNNILLEKIWIGNFEDFGDIWILNGIKSLDLSNNPNVKFVEANNLFTLERLNMHNNIAEMVIIKLGNNNVCIEVDDPVAATNGTAPYDTWAVIGGKHYFTQNCSLSIENFVENNFKIYPNPATEFVSIEQKTTDGVTLQSVQILDSSGKWIKSVKDHFNQIDVSNLSKGMYLFVIQTDKGNKTEKIVIK